MFHRTLSSYRLGDPYEETQEHPDGPLWLLTPDEFDELPDSMLVESIWGKHYYKYEINRRKRHRGFVAYGIRGKKDD